MPARVSELNVRLVGDAAGQEFDAIRTALERDVAGAALDFYQDLPACLAADGTRPPDLVVMLQNHPDEYVTGDVAALMSRFPLARLICCYDAWCDSDGRTRSIWPLAARTPIWNALGRIERELTLVLGQVRDRPLPLTASRAEIFEAEYLPPRRLEPAQGLIGVVSRDHAWQKTFELLLAAAGQNVAVNVTSGDSRGVRLLLWDADPWCEDQAMSLRHMRSRYPHADIAACVGFPRRDLADELRALGVARVVCKLAPISEIVRQLSAGAAAS